jgi:hypothetical protein
MKQWLKAGYASGGKKGVRGRGGGSELQVEYSRLRKAGIKEVDCTGNAVRRSEEGSRRNSAQVSHAMIACDEYLYK